MADFVPARCFLWLFPAPNPDWSEAAAGAFTLWMVVQALVVDDTGHVEVTEDTAPYGQQQYMHWLQVMPEDDVASLRTSAETWIREAASLDTDVPIVYITDPPAAA